jgi:D-amino peptidase
MTEDMAEMATWITGVNRTDSRVARLEDDNLLDLYRRFVAVLRLTQSLASR